MLQINTLFRRRNIFIVHFCCYNMNKTTGSFDQKYLHRMLQNKNYDKKKLVTKYKSGLNESKRLKLWASVTPLAPPFVTEHSVDKIMMENRIQIH